VLLRYLRLEQIADEPLRLMLALERSGVNLVVGAAHGLQKRGHDKPWFGFRVSAPSMLNESGLWNADAIERLLAHVDGDGVRRASARAVQ